MYCSQPGHLLPVVIWASLPVWISGSPLDIHLIAARRPCNEGRWHAPFVTMLPDVLSQTALQYLLSAFCLRAVPPTTSYSLCGCLARRVYRLDVPLEIFDNSSDPCVAPIPLTQNIIVVFWLHKRDAPSTSSCYFDREAICLRMMSLPENIASKFLTIAVVVVTYAVDGVCSGVGPSDLLEPTTKDTGAATFTMSCGRKNTEGKTNSVFRIHRTRNWLKEITLGEFSRPQTSGCLYTME